MNNIDMIDAGFRLVIWVEILVFSIDSQEVTITLK
jgi:hypothetical protein